VVSSDYSVVLRRCTNCIYDCLCVCVMFEIVSSEGQERNVIRCLDGERRERDKGMKG
jgi:hypothetical protein